MSNKDKPVEAVDLQDLLAEVDELTADTLPKVEVVGETKEKPEAYQEKSEAMQVICDSDYPIALAPIEFPILELVLQNMQPKEIAARLNIPMSAVRSFISRKDVKDYIKELRLAMSQLQQSKLLDVYSKMLDARIKKIAEDEDADFGDLSRKDTLDVMRAFNDLLSSIQKTEKDEKEDNIYLQIINEVTKK